MALIKCPECKKKISDQCDNCPKCGYPIKLNLANDTIATADIPEEISEKKEIPKAKRSIFKKIWFWIVVAVIVAAVATAVILHLNRDAEPKTDEHGNPIFVELTDVVYTNAEEYLGYYINVKGKVFQNLGDNGKVKGVQVWLDPDTCEQNLMIYYTTEDSVKDGDYVVCTGYIKEIRTYTNNYGTELAVPLIYSTDLQKSTYIEAMSPTISTLLVKSTYQKLGYSISVSKVEFAENETRVYLTASNKGKSTLYIDTKSSIIVQNGKQFNAKINDEANYEEIPDSLHKGTKAEGVITFPAIKDDEFEYIIEIHSDDYDEEFSPIIFRINQTGKTVKEYEVAIKNALAIMNKTSTNAHILFPEELWKWLDINTSNSQWWLEKQVREKLLLEDQPQNREIPYVVHLETRLSTNEKDVVLENYKSEYKDIGIDSIEDAYNIELEVMLQKKYSQYLNITLIKIEGNWYWLDLLTFG